MTLSRKFAHVDLRGIEWHCTDLVAELGLARIVEHLTPRWRRADPTRQG